MKAANDPILAALLTLVLLTASILFRYGNHSSSALQFDPTPEHGQLSFVVAQVEHPSQQCPSVVACVSLIANPCSTSCGASYSRLSVFIWISLGRYYVVTYLYFLARTREPLARLDPQPRL